MIRQSKVNFVMFSTPYVGWVYKTWFHDNCLFFFFFKYGVPENVHARSLGILGGGGGGSQ